MFSAINLKLFQLLFNHKDTGRTVQQIAQDLNLHWIENESRGLLDVLDALCSMSVLKREHSTYKLALLGERYLLNEDKYLKYFNVIDQQIYSQFSKLDQLLTTGTIDQDCCSSTSSSIKDVLGFFKTERIKNVFAQLDLSKYSTLVDISDVPNKDLIERLAVKYKRLKCYIGTNESDEKVDLIIIWNWSSVQQKKYKIKQAYEMLTDENGLCMIIEESNEDDVTSELLLATSLLAAMENSVEEECDSMDAFGYSKIERQKTNTCNVVLAYK
ncbi:unnamed protein product [Didymodactylos carnosus]|uniref:O-methyltransferase dimerisation domain-containing protein n=1 Tax=Didymodactylos carnosus TaxID=1234261 RepID=A0A813Y5Q4_9BILA|nr:unnamed protein product [Didymodactylos carnosus]CAF0876483.1 unnamed protein product [Didymodactylos carnosus]CAF3524932.1 unnamed protein product [Didymodactylos carnosus]CAF3663300.1 unnamed protein product [Didymodactylos carnosus]